MPRTSDYYRSSADLSAEEILEITEKVKNGGKNVKIGMEYRITAYMVRRIALNKVRQDVKRESVPSNDVCRSINTEVGKKIVALRIQGLKQQQIADQLKISVASVQMVLWGDRLPNLDRTGLKEVEQRLHDNKKLSKEQCQDICRIFVEQRFQQVTISRLYNVSPAMVCKILHGDVYPDVFVPEKKARRKEAKSSTYSTRSRENRKRKYSAPNGMKYNQYGMLVPV